MCGFGGLFSDSYEQNINKIKATLSLLRHRGPDSENYITFDIGVLIHTRLAINDLSIKANQPFTTDGIHYIVFNGEIYNYKQLIKQLPKNYDWITQSDTEVVLRAYLHWGDKCVKYLDGMFAFAIFNKNTQCTFCARDRWGKKPFFYQHQRNSFAFSSTPDALQVIADINFKVDIQGAVHFLTLGYTLAPHTTWEGVKQLEAGQTGTWFHKEKKWQLKRYFEPHKLYEKLYTGTYIEAQDTLISLLNQSVKKREAQEVQQGVLLSSGVDSSIIAFLCKKLLDITVAYTIGFSEKKYNENDVARQVAKKIGFVHHYKIISSMDYSALNAFVKQAYLPIADNSLIACLQLSELASHNVKVAFSGDGADELFGGYPTNMADYLNNYFHPVIYILKALIPNIVKHDAVGNITRFNRFLKGTTNDYVRAHYNWRLIHNNEEISLILGANYKDAIIEFSPLNEFRNLYEKVKELPSIKQHLYVDTQTWLSNNILTKIDVAGMQYGLEIRSPFLDDDIWEFSASLPAQFLFRPGKNKPLLRDAFNNLPISIKQKKKGFNTPIGLWLNLPVDEFKFYCNLIFATKMKPNL